MVDRNKSQLKTWSVMQAEMRFLFGLIGALTIIIIILSISISMTKTEVVVIPSHLTDKVKIVGNEADEGFKKVWGLFVAQLVGNVTPSTVEFMIDNISGLLAPGVYTELNESLKFQSESIRMRKISISFNAKDVYYSEEKDMVWVFGERVVTAAGVNRKKKSTYTYELKVEVRGGYPYIVWFNGYKGSPLIEDSLRENNPDKTEINNNEKKKPDEDKEIVGE